MFTSVRLIPLCSAQADISSVDDSSTNSLGTFNPFFPKGNFFGVIVGGPGPINFIDVHPSIETALPHGVTASLDWIFLWREGCCAGGDFFPGFFIIFAGGSEARFVRHHVPAPEGPSRRIRDCGF